MKTKITKEQIESLVGMSFSYAQIGKINGVSRQRIHQIATGYDSRKVRVLKEESVDNSTLTPVPESDNVE